MKKALALLLILLPLVTGPAVATTRLQKLSEDRYLLSHQKISRFGGQGKALRKTYEKAASLCVVLDYSWFEVRDTQSKGQSFAGTAEATMEVKFYHEQETEDLNDCQALANEKQKVKMRRALDRIR